MTKAKSPIPEGFHSVTPQLVLEDAARAIDWYKKALGAEEITRATGPDGKVIHAELKIGNSRIMLNDVMGGMMKSPKALGGSPMSLWIYCDDADAMFDRAMAAGAQSAGPMGRMQDQFWGDRSGTLIDPSGYQWTIATHKEDLTHEEIMRRQDEFMKQFANSRQ